jgi:hypothetical protein
MLRPRDGFGATVLGDGTLLVVGDDVDCAPGGASPGSETAERYDPVADTWSEAASLNKPRKGFAMVPTIDGGAMVIGGLNADDVSFSSTKRYDPDTDRWSDGPLLDIARGQPSAVAVGDGRIIVASSASEGETSATSTAEIYAPWDGERWWDDGRMDEIGVYRLYGLTDGRVLARGWVFESPDHFRVSDTGGAEGWSAFAGPDVDDIGDVVPLADGGAIAFTYEDSELGLFSSSRVVRLRPGTDDWVDAAPFPHPRTAAQIARLPDGRIIVAGGHDFHTDLGEGTIVTTTDIYDPVADAWSAGPDLRQPRMGGEAITLPDGSVLVLGGTDQLNDAGDTPFCPGALTTVERLYPTP